MEKVITWIDISRRIGPGMPVWPGDTPLTRTEQDWGSVRVGAVTLSLHAGTHADAPRHFLPDGAGIDAIPLEVFVGAAVVVDVSGHERIGPEAFVGVSLAPRVLLRTGAWTDPERFPDTVPTLTTEAVDALAAAGVVLVGVDVPSVDAIESVDLPIHHALAAAGIHILESLDLQAAPVGRCELVALPLRVEGGDAAPVRAAIRAFSTTTGGN